MIPTEKKQTKKILTVVDVVRQFLLLVKQELKKIQKKKHTLNSAAEKKYEDEIHGT